MAKLVGNWRLQAVQDHLDELDSIIHDLKDLYEVVNWKTLLTVDLPRKRDEAYQNLYMIRKLLGLERK